jgi:hypothetical protein
MNITIDHSERDRTRRFEILKGVGWDIDKARELLCWVNTGMTIAEARSFQPVLAKAKEQT